MFRFSMVSAMAVALLGLVLNTGCNMEKGPPRYKLTGDITFNGQPIPNGMIVFTPDNSKGNSGPQGVAIIKNGKYDTSLPEGKGIGGGPTIIRVTGQGDPASVLLCEYEVSVDLPKKDSEHKIEVPATAGNRKTPAAEI